MLWTFTSHSIFVNISQELGEELSQLDELDRKTVDIMEEQAQIRRGSQAVPVSDVSDQL